MKENNSELLMYITEDGQTKIEVTYDNETVWLSLNEISELFQKNKSTISRHIKNVFEEGELERNSVVANFATTASDGKTYNVEYFNLDVIISVGYRVKSHRGTQFRIWASKVLKEYIIKGFSMNDDLLKEAGGGNYFTELLDRIRDIRSSEKVFYRQVLDIYATSIDYDPKTVESKMFFATVQNKLHYATHGKTAAELVFNRVDAEKDFIGMTNFKGDKPTKKDVVIAKNYLSKDELDILNRLVTTFLDFAELQAIRKKPMYMNDWIGRLDTFLVATDSGILNGAGVVSKLQAENKANEEYLKYKSKKGDTLSNVERHYLESVKKLKDSTDNKNL